MPQLSLKTKETEWIHYFQNNKYKLYNETDNITSTNILKSKISKHRKGMLTGEHNGMYGVHRFGNKNPMYGKHHTNIAKQKISLKSKEGNKYIKYTPDLTNKIRLDRQGGMTLKQLNEKYGIAISTLSTLINHGTNKFNT